eukprot:CAMPEP_0177726792 /NCGR_PEP_ID=MMETSP0484_2-20121128/19970_1 /TAXON_ID=354590 /ORGANISM="Rhodomonas lens, Strain RHODO" /LENGTH=218 /DNA_ID=CAMNT_0019239389 /DNA_START=56 /DNA_END=712 /DNA_ORIENTATION=+
MWMAYYLLLGELGVCALLMTLSYLPKIVQRPIFNLISSINFAYVQQIVIAIIAALAAMLAHSLQTAAKHHHPHGDVEMSHKDKQFHDNKRLRAERNSYICFGCLFLFLCIVQLYILLKKLIQLQKETELKDSKHAVLEKQVKNNKDNAGLVEVAKALDKGEGKGKGGEGGGDFKAENEALRKEVASLKEEKKRLENQLIIIENNAKGEAGDDGLRKRK